MAENRLLLLSVALELLERYQRTIALRSFHALAARELQRDSP